jgi:hypothetical protein
MSKKSKIIILFIIIAIISLIIWATISYFKKSKISSGFDLSKNAKVENIKKNDHKDLNATTTLYKNNGEFLKVALESGKVENCLKVSGNLQKDLCVKLVVAKSGDETGCSKISSTGIKEECILIVKSNQAYKTGSFEDCEKLIDDNAVAGCIAKLLDSQKIIIPDCEKLPKKSRDICVSSLLGRSAVDFNDPKKCEEIPLEDYKIECQSSFKPSEF